MEATQATRLPDFTPRELDIIHLIACFYTRNQICKALGICYKTVDNHMRSIFIKTGLHSHVELASYARERGLGIKQSPRITEGLSPSMLNIQKLETVHTVAES